MWIVCKEREKAVFLLPPCVPYSTGLPFLSPARLVNLHHRVGSGHRCWWNSCRWFKQDNDNNRLWGQLGSLAQRYQTEQLLWSRKDKSCGSRTRKVILNEYGHLVQGRELPFPHRSPSSLFKGHWWNRNQARITWKQKLMSFNALKSRVKYSI